MVNEFANTFEDTTYPQVLDQLAAAKSQPQVDELSDRVESMGPPAPPVKQTVSIKKIRATGMTGLLETEADVDRYLDALRGALLDTINVGKRIAL